MTNGDKIRSLTDEELARWLTKLCIEYVELFFNTNFPSANFKLPTEEQRNKMNESFLEELKKEVVDDD